MMGRFAGLAAAAMLLGMSAGAATAAPLQNGAGLVAPDAAITDVQFRRRRPVCRVDVVRRRTPRGVVITRVRRCR
jgi:hypothetical protein